MRADTRSAVLAGVTAFVAYWSTLQVPTSADANAHVLTAFSAWLEGDLDLDEYAALAHPFLARTNWVAGHLFAPYTAGTTLVFAPVALAAIAAGVVPGSILVAGVLPKALAAALVATSAALTFLCLRELVDARVAAYLTLAYALGTAAFSTSSQVLAEHAPSLPLVAGALLLMLRGRRHAAAGSGALLGLATIVRPPNVVLFLAVLAYFARRDARSALRYVLWASPAVVFQLTVNALALGSPLVTARGPVPLGSIPEGLLGLLVSPSRGLLVYTPWLFVAILALALAWRRPEAEHTSILRWGALAFAGTLLLFSTYSEWWGGWTFGDRYLSDLLPLYAVAAADAWRRGWLASRIARALFAVALGWSILLHALGAGLYYFTWHGAHWDVTPNIDVLPSRLWDWTEAQWQWILARAVIEPPPALILQGVILAGCILAFARMRMARAS